jgi:HEAT repeat protein
MPISNNFLTQVALLRDGSDLDPDAEWKAAIELGLVTDDDEREEAVTVLIEALTSNRSHALIRAHAAESLGILGINRGADALLGALDDDYRLVRAYAIRALIRVDTGVANLIPLSRKLNEDSFFGTRAEAAAALGNLAFLSTDASFRQQVRDILLARLAVEQANLAPGVERIIADIQRALERLTPIT